MSDSYFFIQSMGKMVKPKHRSALRQRLGRLYFRLARYLFWAFGPNKFAGKYRADSLKYCHFAHHSLLLRKLKDVDMQYQYNKVVNLKIAASRLDGLLLYPGETFSYWKAIGRPSYSNGYVDGMVLFCGSFGRGVGGGLCQMSNLIYWMTLHTPLTVIERYRHSYDVFPDSGRTQPFGSGATCVYPYRDLMIKNNTKSVFQLRIRIGPDNLEGEWLADTPQRFKYDVIEKEHRMSSDYWGGYSRHNVIYRQVCDLQTGEISQEYVTENHAFMMYPPFLEQ